MKRQGLIRMMLLTVMICMMVTFSQKAEAATKNLKKSGCKFDMKAGKKIEFQTNSIKFGKHSSYVTISEIKKSNAKKKGYKQVTFTIKIDHNYKKSEQKALYNLDQTNYKYDVVPAWSYHIVDYNTGENLFTEGKNKYNVSVKGVGYEDKSLKKKGTKMWNKMKFTITYPENYKGLCFGYGEYNELKKKIKANPEFDPAKDTDGDLFIGNIYEGEDIGIIQQIWPYEITKQSKYAQKYITANDKYWNAKASFYKTGYYHYKHIRDNIHFIRIK